MDVSVWNCQIYSTWGRLRCSEQQRALLWSVSVTAPSPRVHVHVKRSRDTAFQQSIGAPTIQCVVKLRNNSTYELFSGSAHRQLLQDPWQKLFKRSSGWRWSGIRGGDKRLQHLTSLVGPGGSFTVGCSAQVSRQQQMCSEHADATSFSINKEFFLKLRTITFPPTVS